MVFIFFRPDWTLVKASISDNADTVPKKGDIVTFEYNSFSRYALPVAPNITRIRKDIDWQHVVREYASDSNDGT